MWVAASTKSSRDSFTDQQLSMSGGNCQVLPISVDSDAFCALNSNRHQPLDGVVAGSTTPNNNNPSLSHIAACRQTPFSADMFPCIVDQ
jgi:hypothetical protein